MITAASGQTPYKTRFFSADHSAYADTSHDKGGDGAGFRPHELLEAALATCVNMHVRMYAANHNIALETVIATVSLDRGDPAAAIFTYSLELAGDLSTEEKQKLLRVAESCPVRQTLSRTPLFKGSSPCVAP